MPNPLARRIQDTVEEAFRSDFNLIVEEFDLYQRLTPKMQTELIHKLFNKFIARFKYFFNSCEVGFRNEFVIWMFARKHSAGAVVQNYGKEAEEVIFLTEGQVDLYTKPGIDGQKFMQLPCDSIFNDYQTIFKLKSNIDALSKANQAIEKGHARFSPDTYCISLAPTACVHGYELLGS